MPLSFLECNVLSRFTDWTAVWRHENAVLKKLDKTKTTFKLRNGKRHLAMSVLFGCWRAVRH